MRSIPYSRRVPQANRQTLAQTLASIDIEYRWMGEQLGGKPGGEIPDYDQLCTRPSFQQGIAELVSLAREHPTAVMCAEGDHRRCHRHKLIAPSLLEQGFTLLHIQPDGSLVSESVEPRQLTLL